MNVEKQSAAAVAPEAPGRRRPILDKRVILAGIRLGESERRRGGMEVEEVKEV